MKQIIAYALVIAASVLVADYAVAGSSGTYNSQGVSGAQLSVTTSATKVLPFSAGRTEAFIFNGGAATLYCESGPTGGGAPSPAPTSAGANAVPIFPNTSVTLNANGSFTPTGIGLVAQAETDCACATSTCAVNTWELP